MSETYKNGDYKRYYTVDELRIFGFFEEHRYLSNFHKCPVLWDGHMFPSSEHAYMVAKCRYRNYGSSDTHYNDQLASYIKDMSCAQVKKWGQIVYLREDWEDVKNNMMFSILLEKFTRNKDIREKLINTGDKIIIEAKLMG